jgi:hypothetical protein
MTHFPYNINGLNFEANLIMQIFDLYYTLNLDLFPFPCYYNCFKEYCSGSNEVQCINRNKVIAIYEVLD